jgi:hypothetical protein
MSFWRTEAGRGSSPRARGVYIFVRLQGANDRFIPASAGRLPNTLLTPLQTPVHPRERGAFPPATRSEPLVSGSSPRARGVYYDSPKTYIHLYSIVKVRRAFPFLGADESALGPQNRWGGGICLRMSGREIPARFERNRA